MNLTIRKGSFPIRIKEGVELHTQSRRKEVGFKNIGVVEGRRQTTINHQSSSTVSTEPV
jgi:hypothetical protein